MSGSQYYGAKEKHPIDPKRVMLFTIADQEPMANWYVRIKREVKGKGRYFQQSLKTTSLPVAMEIVSRQEGSTPHSTHFSVI